MNTEQQLEDAIDETEIFTEARAILDYQAHGLRTKEWIASHEKLRRAARVVAKQRDALQKQVTELLAENLILKQKEAVHS